MHPEQPENQTRVYDRIAPAVIAFWEEQKSKVCRYFHLQDLVDFIKAQGLHVAPNSPARIMQILKNEGRVNYIVLKRSESLYEALEIGEATEDVRASA
jgi:hypothetical protein